IAAMQADGHDFPEPRFFGNLVESSTKLPPKSSGGERLQGRSSREIALRGRFCTRACGHSGRFGVWTGKNGEVDSRSGGSIFRNPIGQTIARFWFLNASALRRRRVDRTDQPILIPAGPAR